MFDFIKRIFKKKPILPNGMDFYTFDLSNDFIQRLDERRLFYQTTYNKEITMGAALEQLIMDYEYALNNKQLIEEKMEHYLFEKHNHEDPAYQ